MVLFCFLKQLSLPCLRPLKGFLCWHCAHLSRAINFDLHIASIAPFIPLKKENSTCEIAFAALGTLFLCCVRVVNQNTVALLLLVFCYSYATWHVLVMHLTTHTQHEKREAKEKWQDRRIPEPLNMSQNIWNWGICICYCLHQLLRRTSHHQQGVNRARRLGRAKPVWQAPCFRIWYSHTRLISKRAFNYFR